MQFVKTAYYWWTPHFGTNDISFGIHICWKGRVDIHFLWGMLSVGIVPIYKNHNGLFAASNSYHCDKTKRIRASVP
jgi:hypothetical protein